VAVTMEKPGARRSGFFAAKERRERKERQA